LKSLHHVSLSAPPLRTIGTRLTNGLTYPIGTRILGDLSGRDRKNQSLQRDRKNQVGQSLHDKVIALSDICLCKGFSGTINGTIKKDAFRILS
jgi:hypothetical protein